MTAVIAKAARRILKATLLRPGIAVVLGSAFGKLQDEIDVELELPYEALPGFPRARVDGHSGKLLVGSWEQVPVYVLCGRSHFYEGYSLSEVTLPVRVLAACGIKQVLLTNAAGGINPKLKPGALMCITDHLNFLGANPLRGAPDAHRSCFVDLSQAYDVHLQKLLRQAARHAKIRLHSGVYAAVPGPCYETPAEVKALARLGADAVGMSTVPEVIVARHCDVRVAAVSCITNCAAGLTRKRISHEEVLAAGARATDDSARLVRAFLRLLARDAECDLTS